MRRSVECKLGFQWISTFQLKLKALFRLAHTCSTGNRSFEYWIKMLRFLRCFANVRLETSADCSSEFGNISQI